MRRTTKTPFPAVIFFIIFGISLISIVAASTGGGCNLVQSTMNRYTIMGTVSGEIGEKMSVGTESGTTKYSVPLKSLTVTSGNRPSTFGGAVTIVNCTSTQCSALEQASIVEFSCFEEIHLTTPNEEECRFSKIVSVPNDLPEPTIQ